LLFYQFLMMTSANLDSEDIPQHDSNTYLQNCASQFKKLHKFKTNSIIEFRIYQGGKGFGNQLLPFHQTCDIIYSMSTFRYVFFTCADVKLFKFTELDIIILSIFHFVPQLYLAIGD